MERIWLNNYPEFVAHDIDLSNHSSVFEFFQRTCETFPQRPAFSSFGTTLSFSEIDVLSQQFASYLQNHLAMEKGQRLAIMLPNILQYPIALFGAMRIGVIVVNVDPMYTSFELTHQLNDSGTDAIVFLENFGHVVEQTLPQTKIKYTVSTTVGECLNFPKSMIIDLVLKHVKKLTPRFQIEGICKFNHALKLGQQEQPVDSDLCLDDILFLQYTGGTTGVAKGAILTHRNLVANLLQASPWIGPGFIHGEEKAIAALPIYHIFSMTANVLTMVSMGIENCLVANPRDFSGFVKFLKKTDFTIFIGVNTLFRKLLNTPGFEDIDFSRLKLSFAAGMSVTEDVAQDWHRITGSVVVEAYGLTETSPAVCVNPFDVKDFTGSIGLPISSTYVQIKDSQGNDLGINEVGELCIKGPQVTQGYWNNEEENKLAFTEDGFFRTGDIARIDDKGYVYILDRIKNTIIVSGFNVYPTEIENVICQLPGIVEAAAIGIEDAVAGEAIKLFVVADNEHLKESEIKEFFRDRLTGYKQPREIIFMKELPKTNVGKISHKTLRKASGNF